MNVQITGSTGFVGSYLLNALKASCIPVKANIDSDFNINADVVIHLAGIAHNNSKTNSDYFLINTELSKKVFDAFLKSDAKKFIMISSVKAVDENYDGIITENILENPTTIYGLSKFAADSYILSHQLPSEKFIYIIRPAIITGPGVKGNLRSLYKLAKSPFYWLLTSIHNKRSYCNIKNLCHVIQEIINRNDIVSGVYLLADDEPLSTSQVVSLLSMKNNNIGILSIISRFIIQIAIRFGNITNWQYLLKRLNTLNKNYIISNKKITNTLGNKLPYSSSEGIRSIK